MKHLWMPSVGRGAIETDTRAEKIRTATRGSVNAVKKL